MQEPIVIYRINSVRYSGVSEAARKLGVTKQAISNWLTGRRPYSLTVDKITKITVIDK